MKLIIKKESDKIILHNDENIVIEEYSFDTSIDFSKLFKELIKNEFDESIELSIDDFDKTDSETELIEIIKKIVKDYNLKKQELDDFKKQES
jgi:hypothetical protein